MLLRGQIAATLVPQLKGVVIATVAISVAAADITTQDGFLSMLGAALALVVAFFTVRNARRSYWRDLVAERDAEIATLKKHEDEKLAERAVFAEEQRDLRHELKNKVASLEGQLELEQAKHDLSSVYTRLEAVEAILASRQSMFEGIATGVNAQEAVLREILEELRKRPITGGQSA